MPEAAVPGYARSGRRSAKPFRQQISSVEDLLTFERSGRIWLTLSSFAIDSSDALRFSSGSTAAFLRSVDISQRFTTCIHQHGSSGLLELNHDVPSPVHSSSSRHHVQ